MWPEHSPNQGTKPATAPCDLPELDRRHGWEGFRSAPTGSTGAPASISVPRGATAEQVERLVRGCRGVDREAAAAGEDGAQMCLARRGLSLRVDEDGMVVLRGRLLPEVGAVVLRALEAALEQVPAAPADGTRARGGVGRPRGGVGRPRDCLRDYPRRAGACRGNSGYSVVRSDSSSRRRSAWKASWSIPVASLMTDHSIPARKKFSIVPS